MSGFGALAQDYDGFIVDLWGVVHDGVQPFPGVVDCLARLRDAGKRVVFLSNAPRRPAGIAAMLANMGVTPDLYHAIMSSGEAVFLGCVIAPMSSPRWAGGCIIWARRVTATCSTRSPMRKRRDPAVADFILNTGPDDSSGAA